MLVCAPESVPRTGLLNVMGKPINWLRLETAINTPAEFVRKVAVNVVVVGMKIVLAPAAFNS